MSKMNCVLNITSPGTRVPLEENPDIRTLQEMLSRAGIVYKRVDTIPGWYNLNQDWLEFEDVVETHWGTCKILSLSQGDWEKLQSLLEEGRLLMMVHYKLKGEITTPHC